MKTYSVRVQWSHLGTRYPVSSSLRVKASSVAIAANKALKIVKTANRKSFREPADASFRIDVTVLSAEAPEGEPCAGG